jgi:glycosyltransferase involved in cell wall biosynthesis
MRGFASGGQSGLACQGQLGQDEGREAMGKNKNQTVSVIIPAYNRAHSVGRAIRSVLNQTYQGFEIILVDDGSTDDTEGVVRSLNDDRIRYIRHDENKGAAAARNTGITAALGKYIAFQDSDDEWLPEKLEKQIRVLQDAPAEVGIVYSDMWRIRGNRRKYWHSHTMGIGIQTAVVRSQCFDKMGVFDERFPRLIDADFFIGLSRHYCFHHVDEPLVNYYVTPGSICTDNEALAKAIDLILEKHSGHIDKTERLLASYQYQIGNILCQVGDLYRGRHYLLKALKSYPSNTRYLAAAFVSMFGQSAYINVARLKHRISPWVSQFMQ